ncbi:MAG TPA: DUF1559 domain-containing protein [Pirellulales bacterium]|nr:DUF1559 domain-containing protein [Pirellulales bacterium]
MIRRNSCVSRSAQRGFTLVELLVVISIIGTLVALLLPAVQMAREAARRNTCMNNQHNLTLAVTNYTGAKKLYPGYRDVLQTNNGLLPVSWTVAILPYMEQRLVSDQWKQMLGNLTGTPTVQSQLPFPYLESLVCPSDVTALSQATPISYVVNCGQADLYPLISINGSPVATTTSPAPTKSQPLNQPDTPANGIFMSRWDLYWQQAGKLSSLPRNTDDTIRDGKSNTLLLSENLEARNWYDELSLGDPNANNPDVLASGSTKNQTFSTSNTAANNGYFPAPVGGGTAVSSSVPPAPTVLSPEAFAGFVWWPYAAAPPSLVAQINGLPQADVGYATDMMYARPSSNHPGIVVVSYADGRTSTMNENINYLVYCLLMTPDGAKCNPAGLPFIPTSAGTLSTDYTGFANNGVYTGGFRNSTISGQDMQ